MNLAGPVGKRLLVVGLPILAALAMHGTVAEVVATGLNDRWWLLAGGVAAFSLLIATAGVAFAVTRDRMTVVIVIVGCICSAVLVGFHWQVLAAAAIEAASIWTLSWNVRREEAARLKFSIVKILTYGATFTITLLLVAVAFFAYVGFSRGASTGQLQASIVETGVATLNRTLPVVYRDYRPDMTVNQLIEAQLPGTDELLQPLTKGSFTPQERQDFEQHLSESGIDPKSVDLDKILASQSGEREKFINELRAEIELARQAAIQAAIERIGTSFRTSLSGDQPVEDGLRAILRTQVERLTKPNERFVPPILAVSLFLTLVIFDGVYIWLAWLLASLCFWFYKTLGVVKPVVQTATVTRYEIG